MNHRQRNKICIYKTFSLRAFNNVQMLQALFEQNIHYLWKCAVKQTVSHTYDYRAPVAEHIKLKGITPTNWTLKKRVHFKQTRILNSAIMCLYSIFDTVPSCRGNFGNFHFDIPHIPHCKPGPVSTGAVRFAVALHHEELAVWNSCSICTQRKHEALLVLLAPLCGIHVMRLFL